MTADALPGCENRRIAPRLNRGFPISYEGDRSCALNVSATGIRILARGKLAPDQPVHLRLEIEPDLVVSVRGRPVWQQAVARGGAHVVGIAFEPGQHREKARIARWIHQQRAA